MPTIQDIERFKQDIRTLGKETELLERWGESYEDIPPPEQGVPTDISELIEPSKGEAADLGALDGAQAGEEPGDLASFLDSLSLEPLPGMEEPESPLGAGLEAPEDFSDLDTNAAVDFGKPVPEFEGLEASTGQGLADEARAGSGLPPVEEEGMVPEALLQGLSGELEGGESEAMEEVPLGPEELDLLGDLEEIPEPAGEAGAESPEPDAESIQEGMEGGPSMEAAEAGFEGFDFSIPEFGDENEAPSSSEEGPPQAEAPGAEEELSAESAFDAQSSGQAAAEEPNTPENFEDSFDSFQLDETAPGGFGAAQGEPGGKSLDEELASLEKDLLPTENFSLDSSWGGDDFSIPGYETPAPAPPSAETGENAPEPPLEGFPGGKGPEKEEPAPEVALSEAQVNALQDTLLSYPLNLRLAVEETIAEEKGTEAQRSRLVLLLVKGGAPAEASDLVSRILKRPIPIPKDYAKRTGAEIEAEKESLPYILRHTVAPIAGMVAAVVLGLGVIGLLGYRFIYQPIRSELLYRQGYEEIRRDSFSAAEELFSEADKIWVHKPWYYRYAEAYVTKNQFIYAAQKYDALLERWPNDRRGVLEYATMEFQSRLDYAKASKLLKNFIEDRNYYDKDALLLLGDVYLEWAENEEEHAEGLFEDARLQYSTLLEHYGSEDPYLERMLRWFLRTERVLGRDNHEQIRELKDRFMANPKSRISPMTLADLGGYLLDRGEIEDVSNILMRAVDADPSVPETHYELSRYFRRIGNSPEERTALANTIRLLENVANPTNRRIGMLVQALNRQGESYAERKEYVTAEDSYTKALERYERALSLGQLRKGPGYGKIYANLGDIRYFQSDDLDGALRLYERAGDQGYVTPETLYKEGYVHYRRGRWEQALEGFYRSGLDSEESPYLLYATGNALFQREDYFAAQGYYSRLVDRLNFELEQLPLVEPQVRPSHGEIVDLLMRATNNLGVTLFQIGNRMGDARRRASAMAQFSESSRYYDALERDPKTMIRPETKNLAYLNLDFVLHPRRGIDLSIYPDLPKDIKFPRE